MAKKIFDIVPKSFKEKEESKSSRQNIFFKNAAGKPAQDSAKNKKEAVKGNKKERPRKSFNLRVNKALISVFCLAFLLGITGFFVLPHAKVAVWPKIESLNYKTGLNIDKSLKDADFQNKIIPGQIIEETKEITQSFSASGKQAVEQKATGIIRIYNNYSSSPQVLISTTRFISDSGKIFRLKERVTVPGALVEKGKMTASFIDASVAADKAGEEYNIGPSTFSVPGFVGTPKYTGFYGKSLKQMEGGFLGEKPAVTQLDLENAKNYLIKEISKELGELVKSRISSGLVLLQEVYQEKIGEPVLTAKTGDSQPTFTGKITASGKGIAFNNQNLENFAKDYFFVQTKKDAAIVNKKIKEGTFKTDYSIDKIELDKGKMSLRLEIAASAFSQPNEGALKNNLLGMSQKEITDFFSTQPQIAKAEVSLSPFWVKKIPKNIKKVEIEIKL